MKPEKQATHLILLQPASTGIYWLEINRDNESLNILGAGFESMVDTDEDDKDESSKQDSSALQTALQAINHKLKLGWMTKHEVIVIARSHRLTARFLEAPAAEEETLNDLVSFEVSEALHVPLEDISWDMLISSGHETGAQTQLLWVAARKEYVDELLHSWPEDRLAPTQVTPDFWGYYEYILGADPAFLDEPSMIITQEDGRASITIADRKAIYLTRSVPLKRPVPASEKLDEAGAEEYSLALEIERTLYYAADRFARGSIKGMLCCGFEDWSFDRIKTVANNNGLELSQVTKSHILESFSGKKDDITSAHLSLLCIAYCSLNREIAGPNLLEDVAQNVDWKSFLPEAALPSKKFTKMACSLAGIFLLLWIGKGIWFSHAVEARLEEGKDLLKLSSQLQKEEVGLRQMTSANVNYAELFLFLAETLPENILIKNINLDIKSGVEIALKGGNNQGAVDLQKKLNDSPFFRDILLDRSVIEKEGFTIYLRGKLQPSR